MPLAGRAPTLFGSPFRLICLAPRGTGSGGFRQPPRLRLGADYLGQRRYVLRQFIEAAFTAITWGRDVVAGGGSRQPQTPFVVAKR